MLSTDRPTRAKSSPLKLPEGFTIAVKKGQAKRDHVYELGEIIQNLADMMCPPQRSINNAMRELLSTISKLQAKEDHIRQRESNRILASQQTVVEVTPKRPQDNNQINRKTPPKRTKTSHEERTGKTVVNKSCEEEKSDNKCSRMESSTEEDWTTVQRKEQKKKN